jgi:hypothetical protein
MTTEEKLSQYDSKNVVTKKFLQQLDMDSSSYEFLFNQYKFEDAHIDQDIDFDEFSKDEGNLKDFEGWLRYEFDYRFNEQKSLYETLFRNGNGRMTLFRSMYVPKEWISSLSNGDIKLGIFWAYEEDAAEAHWGHGQGTEILLQTSVTEEQIDYTGTFEANLHPSVGEEEKEIRLNEHEKIPLEALWVENNEIKLNKKIKSNIYLT